MLLYVKRHSVVLALVQVMFLPNNGLSVSDIRHETSLTERVLRSQNGQIASVALMDARSIAATAANKGYLTAADRCGCRFHKALNIFFDKHYL